MIPTAIVDIGPYKMTVRTDARVGTDIVSAGLNYERQVHEELKRLLPNARAFMDIGANMGIHVLGAKVINRNIPVFAFEPSPANVRFLCANITNNKLPNVTVYPVAVSSGYGFAWFNNDEENSQPLDKPDSWHTNIWPSFAIGSFVGLNDVDVIKIDVEGFEFHAWKGMTHLLSRRPAPAMIFEFNLDAMKNTHVDPLEAIAFLRRLGYTFRVLENKPGMRSGVLETGEQIISHISRFGEIITDVLAEVKL